MFNEPKEIKAWRARDGAIFSSKAEAKEHNYNLWLSKYIEESRAKVLNDIYKNWYKKKPTYRDTIPCDTEGDI